MGKCIDNGMGNMGDGVGDSRVGNGMGNLSRVGNWMGHRVGCRGVRVDSLTGVADLGNIAVDVVGMVVDRLDPAVGEIDRVGSLHQTGAVVALLLTKGGLRVVVGNSIGVTVRMVA